MVARFAKAASSLQWRGKARSWAPAPRFIVTAEWRGMDKMGEVAKARTGQQLSTEAPAASPGGP
jgi:hypothetical protein